ncbi:MAG: 30S ribosomal protein S2 [Aigarchaeota archaeon]|nr:30S ribosomal protein S2 [Aigarchaeota archaeon]MDW8092272.1 30S ribosomal protein S2 [Nitrososphaerota archaeon]
MSEEVEATFGAELQELLVKSGAHLGAKIKVKHMERFIYKLRADGIYLIDVKKILNKLNMAARMITMHDPKKVVVVTTHVYGIKAVNRFCELTGCTPIAGKIPPGTFTNRVLSYYLEPELLLVSDPRYDAQAVFEAKVARIPVIAMCSTDNVYSNVDVVIPINNRGRTSLPFAFWYLARQVLIESGRATPELLSNMTIDQFTAQPVEGEE